MQRRIGKLEKIDKYYYFLVVFRVCVLYLLLIPCWVLENIWQMYKSDL